MKIKYKLYEYKQVLNGNDSASAQGQIDAPSKVSPTKAAEENIPIKTKTGVHETSPNREKPIADIDHPVKMNAEESSVDVTMRISFKIPSVPKQSVPTVRQSKNHRKFNSKVAFIPSMMDFSHEKSVTHKNIENIPKIPVSPTLGGRIQTNKLTLQPSNFDNNALLLSPNILGVFSSSKVNSPSNSPLEVLDKNSNSIKCQESTKVIDVSNKENLINKDRYPRSMYISPVFCRPNRRVPPSRKESID